MGIQNRSLEDEQKKELHCSLIRGSATGESDIVFHAPHAMDIDSAKLSAVGLSGSPTAQLQIQRFVTGAGQTTIALGPAVTLVAVGTSGPQSFSFSSTALQAGDQIVATHAGTNAAVDQLAVAMVVEATQDIKSWDF